MMNLTASGIYNDDLIRYFFKKLDTDISNLEKREYKKVFGNIHEDIVDKFEDYGYFETPLIPFLNELTIDRELTMMFHLTGMKQDKPYNIHDFIGDYISMYYEDENVISSMCERSFICTVFTIKNKEYIALKVPTEIKTVYSFLFIFRIDGDWTEISYALDEYSIDINGTSFDVICGDVYDIDGEFLIDEYKLLDKLWDISQKVKINYEVWQFWV